MKFLAQLSWKKQFFKFYQSSRKIYSGNFRGKTFQHDRHRQRRLHFIPRIFAPLQRNLFKRPKFVFDKIFQNMRLFWWWSHWRTRAFSSGIFYLDWLSEKRSKKASIFAFSIFAIFKTKIKNDFRKFFRKYKKFY